MITADRSVAAIHPHPELMPGRVPETLAWQDMEALR